MLDYTYTNQSFMRGIGSLGNLSGKVLAQSYDAASEADLKAIESDWRMVGEDLGRAMDGCI